MNMEFLNSEIEVITLSFGQLVQNETVVVDENVQRKVSSVRKKAVSSYILAALSEKTRGAYFAPIVCSRRDNGVLAILDGQHRFYGYLDALKVLETHVKKIEKALFSRDEALLKSNFQAETDEDVARLEGQLQREQYALKSLYNGVFPVMVYNGLTPPQEQQLFHDLNNLGKKVPSSLSMFYNHADLYSNIARTILELNWIRDYISIDRKLDGKSLFLFSTIVRTIEQFVGKDLNEENYNEVYADVESLFEIVVSTLPQDAQSDRYLYRDSKILQGIGAFARRIKEEFANWREIVLNTLVHVSFERTNTDLVKIGGAFQNEDGFVVFNATGSGIASVVKTLMHHAFNDTPKTDDEQGVEQFTPSAEFEVASAVETDEIEQKIAKELSIERTKIIDYLASNDGKAYISKSDVRKICGIESKQADAVSALKSLVQDGTVTLKKEAGKPNLYTLV